MTLTPFTKPVLTLDEQLDRLAERGLHISDRAHAFHTLERISYYRLSGYWIPLKRPDDTFQPGADFETALTLYEFDRRLRLSVLDAIERAEIALRTSATYQLAHRYGPFGHTVPDNFSPQFRHDTWQQGIEREAARSTELFANLYQQKYAGFPRLPLWMATELISLGALSFLYSGMKRPDQDRLASPYGIQPVVLRSWLHTLTYIRNVCAHHSRLWNRVLAVPPELPRRRPEWQPPKVPHNDRLWVILLILRQLMTHHHQGVDWQTDVERLIEPLAVEPRWRRAMGLPDDWREHSLWIVR